MANIGALTVDSVKGKPNVLKRVITITRVPGINGFIVLDTGQGDGPFTVDIEHHASQETLATLATNIQDLQGRVITIVPDQGGSFTNRVVKSISDIRVQAGTPQWILNCTITGVALG